ncbi:MAG: GEVED domain-containing protein, partial [Kiritimatiellia bacterium]
MKTMRAFAGCGAGVLLWFACWCEGAPSLSVTKPPVQLPTLMTGPPVDPTAAQGQWFIDGGGSETVRSNEFYDEVSGGLGANAITGYVDNVVYMGGPGTPIQGFSIQATIHNDTTIEAGWTAGSNSHGESRPRDLSEMPYVGPLIDVKLAVEFAIGDTNKLPLAFNYPAGPYREGEAPFIEAINEDQWGWYCWNPEDPDPSHQPSGGYFVPTWDFGTIPHGQSATRQLSFVVVPPGLQPTDPRYLVIVASYTGTNDVLLNRSQSLKISTWIDDLALDLGSGMEEPPPLRLSDVSVFHNPEQEEEQLDFGDAPDPTYPTLFASDGARHTVVPGVFMGVLIDAEADGQPNAGATGDDMANLADEDGVVLPPQLYVGVVSTASVTVSAFGYLTAWIDYNANGSWELGERVFGAMVVTAGVNNLVFTVPSGTPTGATYARFRHTTQMGALLPTGAAPDGEVEDYQVTIAQEEEEELDFGDAPDPAYPTLLVNNGARHVVPSAYWLGAIAPDAEPDGIQDPQALGDDNNNVDDEDLVAVHAFLVQGSNAMVDVVASSNGYFNAWVDHNQNGSWADSGEQVMTNYVLIPGSNQVPWLTPSNALLGTTFCRVRFCSYAGLSFTGSASDGEVEDYEVTIHSPEGDLLDFGDADDPVYPTLRASTGACHTVVAGVYLGAAVDAEVDGQPDGTATGDDNNPPAGIDDEDGVGLPPVLYAGSTVAIPVTASVAGFLNAWIDWNGNGTWGDPGDQVYVNWPLTPGPNLLPLTVPTPPAFVAGGPQSRWRFTTNAMVVPGPGYQGLWPDGEVEDYEVRLESLDFGDAPDGPYPTLLASDGARHRTPSAYWLGGVAPDTEPDGLAD